MALKQRQNIGTGGFSLPVGAAAIDQGSVVKFSSSEVIVTTANEDFIGVTIEDIEADAPEVKLAGIGDIVKMRAHDADIAEGDILVPAADGRVDTAAALTSVTQYMVGKALQASSAQDQLISVLYIPQVLTKAAA